MNQIGCRIIQLESVDSTNNYIANLLKQGNVTHGTVILADEQFEGKGQRGAVWQAEPGKNLTFSLFWQGVNLSVEEQFMITEFISLVLVEALGRFGIEGKIKWPNDIYVNDKKIAGILIENQLQGSQIISSIIGIGLNVNQKIFGDYPATSISLEKGSDESILHVLMNFLEVINDRSRNGVLIESDRHDEYVKKLYLEGELAEFESTNNGCFKGRIKDVGKDGKLQIALDGGLREFDLKEIRFIPRNA